MRLKSEGYAALLAQSWKWWKQTSGKFPKIRSMESLPFWQIYFETFNSDLFLEVRTARGFC